MRELSFVEAVHLAQRDEMRRDPNVFLIGEDVRCNMMGTTGGYLEEFGPKRILDAPISEAVIAGAAAGAAMVGMRPIIDFGVSSFMYCALDQLISIAAKSSYLYGGQTRVPMVVRSVLAYDFGMAAQHSDRPHPLFMGMPGFKVAIPSNPGDMMGLLRTAIRDDDPVIMLEDHNVRSTSGPVPEGEYLIPFGEAATPRHGTDVTVVAIGGAVLHALAAAEELAKRGISVEVIDPRTLVPLDKATILASVRKTGRLVAVDPANTTCSAASEIAAIVVEQAFAALKGPILRVTTPDIHMPFSRTLEAPLYPNKDKIIQAVERMFVG